MSTRIFNSDYLSNDVPNRPIIGYHSLVAPGGFSSPDSIVGAQEANLWSPDTYTFWQSTNFGGDRIKHIVMDLGSSPVANYVALVGFRTTASGIPVVAVQGSNDSSSWVDLTPSGQYFGPTEPGQPLFIFFDDSNYRYVRLELWIASGFSSSDYYTVEHIRCGVALVLERPSFVGNSPFSRQVEKITNRSDSGKYLGETVVSEVRRVSVEQQHNSNSFVRSYVVPFLEHCESIGGTGVGPKGSFFYSWRPEEFPGDTYYCHAPENVNWPTYSRPNKNIGFDWSVSGMAEK